MQFPREVESRTFESAPGDSGPEFLGRRGQVSKRGRKENIPQMPLRAEGAGKEKREREREEGGLMVAAPAEWTREGCRRKRELELSIERM